MNEQFLETLVIDGRDQSASAFTSAQRRVDTFTRGLSRVAKLSVRPVISILDKATAPLRSITNMVAGLGRSITRGLGLGAGYALFHVFENAVTSSVGAIGDFDASMRAVATLSPTVRDNIGALSDQVLTMSKSVGVDAVDAANALYEAVSAGVPADNLIDFVTISSKAAIAGVTDTSTVIDGLTSVINAYKLSADQAGAVSDVMFQAVNLGKITFGELASSIGIVAPLASTMGVDFTQVAGAAASITKQGIPAGEAMTDIRSIMVALQKPTQDLTDVIHAQGYATGQAMIDALGFQGTLESLRAGADKLGIKIPQMTGRIEGAQAIFALTGENAKGARDDLLAMANSAGQTDQAFKIMSAGLNATVKRLGVAFQTSFIQLGGKILPTLTPIIGALADALPGAMDAAIAAIMPLGAVFDSLRPVFSDLADAASAFFQALTSDPGALGVVGDLIQKYFGEDIANVARGFLQAGMDIVNGIKGTVGQVVDALSPNGDLKAVNIPEILLNGFTMIPIVLLREGKKIVQRLIGLFQNNKAGAQKIGVSLVTEILAGVGRTLRTRAFDLMEIFGVSMSGKVKAVEAFNNIVAAAQKALGWISDTGWPAVESAATTALTWISDTGWPAVSGAATSAMAWATDTAWPAVQAAATTALNWIETTGWPAVQTAASTALTWATDTAWPAVQSAASTALTWIQTVGWPAVSGAAQTSLNWIINTAWPLVQAGATDAMNWITYTGLPMIEKAAKPALQWLVYDAWPDMQSRATAAFNAISMDGIGGLQNAIDALSPSLGDMLVKLSIPQNIRETIDAVGLSIDHIRFILEELGLLDDLQTLWSRFDLVKGVLVTIAGPAAAFGLALSGVSGFVKDIADRIETLLGQLAKLVVWFENHPTVISALTGAVQAGASAVASNPSGALQTAEQVIQNPTSLLVGHAQGAIALKPHVAVVGDNPTSPEVVAPLSDLPRYMGAAAGATSGVQIGSMSFAFTFGGDAPTTPAQMRRLAKQIGPLVADEIAANLQKRRGTVVGGVS